MLPQERTLVPECGAGRPRAPVQTGSGAASIGVRSHPSAERADGVEQREETVTAGETVHITGLTDEQRARYLSRIGMPERALPPDVVTLRALQRAHLRAVPFENLDIHLGRSIILDTDAIVGKIVDDRRGGFCYELNGAFAALLASLGYSVTLHEARVTETSIPSITSRCSSHRTEGSSGRRGLRRVHRRTVAGRRS